MTVEEEVKDMQQKFAELKKNQEEIEKESKQWSKETWDIYNLSNAEFSDYVKKLVKADDFWF